MKKITLFMLAVALSATIFAQNLIMNGSFENNTATSNISNMTFALNSIVPDCFEVDGGTIDLITANACGTASDGSWFVTCSPQGGVWPYMAFSFKLSSTLTLGAQYTLTFDKRFCGPNSSPIDIGLSNDSTLMGTAVHTFAAPLANAWQTETYIFQAMLAADYLTVNVGATGSTGIVGLDNFSLQAGALALNTISEEQNVKIYPNPSEGVFTISLPNTTHPKGVEMFNVLGEKVYEHTLTQTLSNEIDLSWAPKGMYMLKIYIDDRAFTQKIEIE